MQSRQAARRGVAWRGGTAMEHRKNARQIGTRKRQERSRRCGVEGLAAGAGVKRRESDLIGASEQRLASQVFRVKAMSVNDRFIHLFLLVYVKLGARIND